MEGFDHAVPISLVEISRDKTKYLTQSRNNSLVRMQIPAVLKKYEGRQSAIGTNLIVLRRSATVGVTCSHVALATQAYAARFVADNLVKLQNSL